ncbi:hypothetical protein Clacol_000846 [Clathrus columnatus]|uniref:O-methyltransferase C-terminal domain-containing protein n=1 Tax=Clathrus columnatus TaxID=1419009 RepID=A0AAV4ZZF1_9AGAM|nr:hypothetical protein Clacol_000846 [Clathrus columnatus]
MPPSTLRQLLSLITDSVTHLEEACDKNGTPLPDLNAAFNPKSETFRKDPIAAEAANIIAAAAFHLCAIVSPPAVTLYQVASGPWKAAALRICLESNAIEIIREAGPKGIHVNAIAAQNGQDPRILARCLRYMATYHIFREVKPDVFANNRISSLLDTMKLSDELFDYLKAPRKSMTTRMLHWKTRLDEGFKAAAHAWEACLDPTTRLGDPSASPFSKSIGRSESLWQYYARSDQTFRRHRFNIAMQGIQALQPPDAILTVYKWKKVPPGSVIVDVGGGIGTAQFPLVREFPHLKIIIQDTPKVVDEGIKLWRERMPEALNAGRVSFEAQDFFESQPLRNVSFFFLKQILHDWSDEYCTRILKQLRKAASKRTKLLCMDSVIPYACHDPSADPNAVGTLPGSVPHEAPAPLLANWGPVNAMAYRADLGMFILVNAQERTIGHMERLFKQCGWRIVQVHRQEGDKTFLQSIEAVPI